MSGAHKEAAFEDAIEAELLASGWHQGNPSTYRKEYGLDASELEAFIGATQMDAWTKRLAYYGDDQDAAQEAFDRLVASEIDRRGVLDVLRRGVKDRGIGFKLAYFRPAHTIADDALVQYEANRLTVTRQLHYSEKTPADSLDLTLFLNGIPIATAELKNHLTGQTVDDAKKQYRQDRDPKELLFAKRTLAHFAVDPELVFVTTRLDGERTRFLPFNTGSRGPGAYGGAGNPPAAADGYRTSYLWREIWEPDTWLDLIRRFLHVEMPAKQAGRSRPDPHRAPMIFPRYHQWHAVRTLTNHAAAHGAGHNYLVMHSAGSGKSNTIAWLAHRLHNLHNASNEAVFDKVIVITDRVVLDRQLQDTIYQFDHVTGVVQRIDQDSGQLADALQTETAKIVITTLQKFPFVLEKVEGLRGKRFAVIVDEAHSSQSGEDSAALKKVQLRWGSDDFDEDGDPLTASALARGRHEMLSYFAFTATPKPKTLQLFGVRDPATGDYRPIHTYSMRQAIEEGFILDVLRNYITYQTYWRLANANPDDPEVDKRKAAAQLARFAAFHPTSLSQKAEIIVEHFMRNTRHRLGGRAKAMVVASSREHAVRLYLAIRRYIEMQDYPDPGVLVAFSGSLKLDGDEVTEARFNHFGEAALAERFGYTTADDRQRPPRFDQEFRILVVAEKYQTGFDQPLLTTMYVDKPLKGVAAVQTLSRLNRTQVMKSQDDVFVLDFANEADDIAEQFRPFFEEAVTPETDPNLLYTAQQAVWDFQLLVEEELQRFAEAYLAAEHRSSDDADWRKAHQRLYRFTDPARDRFVALAGDDPEQADAFRAALRKFVRLYAFLSQMITWAEEDLERLYLYGRHLLNRLPARDEPTVDIGQVDLTHLRLSKTGEHDVSLEPEGEQMLAGYTGDASGPQHDPDKVPLSQLIEDFNERHGLGLTEADKVWVEQQIAAATEDSEIEAAALANDEENFQYVFNDRFEGVVINQHEGNTELMKRYFDDDTFRGRLTDMARREAYRVIRRKHDAA